MTRKTQEVAALISALLVLAIITLAASASLNQDTFVTGIDIYRLNCASCHETDRAGNPPHYPSLLSVKAELTRMEIYNIIDKGKDRMPAFPHLTAQEKEALVAFLLDEKLQSVGMSSGLTGERLFKSNCASCHRATIHDSKPSNICMMEAAPLAGATTRFTKEEFFKIMKSGICYMPSFDHFTSSETEALYAFLKSLEGNGEPSRPTMGEMCPMMMRMRKGE